eukprot:6969670-Prymnesium_polylepis.1
MRLAALTLGTDMRYACTHTGTRHPPSCARRVVKSVFSALPSTIDRAQIVLNARASARALSE